MSLKEKRQNDGERARGRQGDKETRRQGDKETRRQGDKETRRQGDKETRRVGRVIEWNKNAGFLMPPHHSATPSSCPHRLANR
ncbi:hypothetical protein CKO51_11835 [Rhodopirellula sp. SM50]|nr:hypothetical protein CKO51_11835 [Rhodopirellula sp. SM50]